MSFDNIFSETSDFTVTKSEAQQGRLTTINKKDSLAIEFLSPVVMSEYSYEDYSEKYSDNVHLTFEANLVLPTVTHYRLSGEKGFTQFSEESDKSLVDFAMKVTESVVILKEGHVQGLSANESYIAAYGDVPPAITPSVKIVDVSCGYGEIKTHNASFEAPDEYLEFSDLELPKEKFEEITSGMTGENEDLLFAIDQEVAVIEEEALGETRPLSIALTKNMHDLSVAMISVSKPVIERQTMRI